MNKTAIKNFAVWARRRLISEITYKAGLVGIREKGVMEPLSMSTSNVQFFDIGTGSPIEISGQEIGQRKALVDRIREKESSSDYKTAFQYVIEEVAYTWFNRLIAIRFMEVNDYLPSRIRVLSSETMGKAEPDTVTTPFDTDIEFSADEKDMVIRLKHENRLDELFRFLFIKQCNKLNEILPELFEETADYTELLLTISFTDKDGIVSHLVNDVAEEDFTEAVEIIGWMYQYYNTEPKDEVFALLKKNVKITKDRIPAATQLFTPDWIVRYMVENSLGRLWIERERAISGVSDEYLNGSYFGWKYYLEEAEQEESVKAELERIRAEYKKLKPEDIKIIDPCMGSGHILVYAFEVLMQIYESQGYTQRDAASAIIENNLYGLDVDDRAHQLAYFAIMMKGRKYDRRYFTRRISPRIYSIQESNTINRNHLEYFGSGLSDLEYNDAFNQVNYLVDTFKDAKEYGSILNVNDCNWDLLRKFTAEIKSEGQLSIEAIGIEKTKEQLLSIIDIGQAMALKYHVVVTNPPYMGSSGMNPRLSEYVKKNYPDSKSDLFAVFIERGLNLINSTGYNCMVTMQSWMFLASFEKLRKNILSTRTITNLMHMENMVMGIAFGTAVSNLYGKHIDGYKGCYNHVKLSDIANNEPKTFPPKSKRNVYTNADNFSKIPGMPVAYWVGEPILNAFSNNQPLGSIAEPRQGLATADNNRFLRFWFEVTMNKMGLGYKSLESAKDSKKKWFPYNKGGEFRKWYGNKEYLVNWENDGFEIRNFSDETGYIRSRAQNTQFYFKESITWSFVSSSYFGVRFSPVGALFDVGGSSVFPPDGLKYYLIGLLCSKLSSLYMQIQNPTLNFQVGNVASLPFIEDGVKKITVDQLVDININLSCNDWDSFETSWDFKKHPLLDVGGAAIEHNGRQLNVTMIELCFNTWQSIVEDRFLQLKANEEELNRIFIDIYGLQDELTPDVADKDVTVARIYDTKEDIPVSMKGNNYVLTKADVIKSLISYAVGCMFGRYSLDEEGLILAGQPYNERFVYASVPVAGGGPLYRAQGDCYLIKADETLQVCSYAPQQNNILLISDEEYLSDDIVGRLVEFVKCVCGAETLEENLDFIAEALSNKGNTSREVIRNYFIKDFYKDHVKTYKKRPIYWLYDSGKQDGFKALIYMHRYNPDTTGLVRVDYLHKMQKIYASEIDRMKDLAEKSDNTREIARADKRREKLIKQLKETTEYDEKIAHLALSRIEIDLDDGVKVNYEKVQTDALGKQYPILAKI